MLKPSLVNTGSEATVYRTRDRDLYKLSVHEQGRVEKSNQSPERMQTVHETFLEACSFLAFLYAISFMKIHGEVWLRVKARGILITEPSSWVFRLRSCRNHRVTSDHRASNPEQSPHTSQPGPALVYLFFSIVFKSISERLQRRVCRLVLLQMKAAF
jgi:hypothetical protein